MSCAGPRLFFLYSDPVSSNYPEDEFENPPEGSPVGAHRKPPSRWRPVLPFLLVLVIVPVLAWGFTALLQHRGSTGLLETLQEKNVVAEVEQSKEAPQSAPKAAPQSEEKPAAQPEPEPEEPPAPEVDHATLVEVLNETAIDGYAGQVAAEVAAGGFGSVEATNTEGWLSEENTVFYAEESQIATAQEVARLAGISRVVLDPGAASPGTVVVLLVH